MIIFRYLCREILSATFAVCLVLLLVLISGRFVKYLANAVAGQMEPGVIFAVIGYRIPGFLELTLPLAFFLAILLSFGRFYVENEMSVLKACGISEAQLLGYTSVVAIALALVVGWLSLTVSPAGVAKAETIFAAQEEKTELDKLTPKKFYSLRGGKGVTYADQVNDNQELEDVFLAVTAGSAETFDSRLVIVVAERGRQQKNQDGSDRYLVLDKGYRVEGVPGSHEYQVTHFEEYGSRLEPPAVIEEDFEINAMPTSELLNSDDIKRRAALQWRLSIPVMILVVTLLAVPLSRTDPRQGRYTKLLPAVMLYFAYLVMLNALRGALESGSAPIGLGLMPVHLLFLAIALLLLSGDKLKRLFKSDTAAKSAAHVGDA
ncbi:MAG: LPS export ABC transporter permease LptF [Porticoccaceae bacterium]|nr:LPS export ABC transporter permease LptF [Porticoccaceae bacterium]MBT5578079.1 LPS export ABC transporter permease LptF [Porticoccaceae bacterium]